MSQFRRPPRRRVDGVLLLDKPQGLSSNTALQIARRLFNADKAGHTGTLDPMATGLLPLCFGEATKFSQTLLDADKGYDAVLQLGVTTDTGDAEGAVLENCPVAVSRDQVDAAIARYTGTIEQVPPMYSALKRDGKPLYELARQGIEVERLARQITIHEITVNRFEGTLLDISVLCTKGTYIRTLAQDIGAALGCGAHLVGLRRTRSGDLNLAKAVSLEQIEALTMAQRDALLAPPDALLASLPTLELESDNAARLMQGQTVRVRQVLPAGQYRIYGGQTFLGLGELAADGCLRPKRLLVPPAD